MSRQASACDPPGAVPASTHPEPPAPPVPWRRLALGAAGCMFVGMGIGRFSYTTMVPALVESGLVSAVDAGRIGMLNLGGFLLGAVLSVSLAQLAGRRRTVLSALGLCLVLLAASAAPLGAVWLALCRGIIGITTGLMMVLSLALVAETAPADRRAEASGYMFAGVGLGIMASALVVPPLLVLGLPTLWTALAGAALAGATVAAWGWAAMDAVPAPIATGSGNVVEGGAATWSPGLKALLAAHALFSVGLVPHTIYWIDFLKRGLGVHAAELAFNWSLVGVFAFLGPMLAAALARAMGTAVALVLSFLVIGAGIGAPAVLGEPGNLVGALPIGGLVPALLLASAVLFGAQPGLSSLMAARVRDLGRPDRMPGTMRAMILANACGGLAGGIIVPWGYAVTGRHQPLFLLGGLAMAAAAVAVWPRRGAATAAG